MSIQPISSTTPSQNKYKKFATGITGYGALATGIASGIVAHNKKIKLHKTLAYIAGALALAHVGIVEYFHHNKKAN